MKEHANEILLKIKNDFPGFNKDEILEFTKDSVLNLYNQLKNENTKNLNYEKNLIDKLIKNKNKFRISKDIDHISVQYVELFDYIKQENKNYIKIYCSIYFYDNTQNNLYGNRTNNKYWNDIWIITFTNGKQENRNCCSKCRCHY